MAERGLSLAHTTIMRGVQRYAPEPDQVLELFQQAGGALLARR
jgi:transposase-like protein